MIQLLWLTLLAAHTGVAAVWWWVMPGGFPSTSTEFWLNQVASPMVVGVMLVALLARGRIGETLLPPILAAIPVFWMAFGISSRIVFFESFRSLWNLPVFLGAGVAGLWVRQFRFRTSPRWLVPALALPMALAGWALPGALQAPEPATRPLGGTVPEAPAGPGDHKLVKLTRDAQLRPGDSRVVIRHDKLVLNVQPLLTFANRSPDRFFTGLAPEGKSPATTRTLAAKVHDGARWTLHYRDEDASVLEVTPQGGAIHLDARSRLARPIYSHGNSFTELTLQGHQKLSVAFSPAPGKRVEIPAPGEPARFAYLDEGGTFHVMQASAQQRGPFQELAAGPLKRGEPLVLTLFDGDQPAFTVTLDDWAAQAATQLSPAAGWGVAANVIELLRGGEPDSAPVLISLSLAATSVGRGTQSVGHAAGVYRNRVTVKTAPR